MDSQTILVFITAPTQETARTIALDLVERRLAACVNILPGVNSIYRWNDAIQDDQEVLLVVKSRQEHFEAGLIPAVQALHPYDLPEIIALPVTAGLPAYLSWIESSTRPG
jgi:periplasmic divalent cation tolerance protein